MSRPQFSIRTLLWLTLAVAIGFAIGPPLARNYAPKWGEPQKRTTAYSWNGIEIESTWPTGRVERRDFSWHDQEAANLQP